MGDRPTLSDFEPHVGSRFTLNVDQEDGNFDIELVGVEALTVSSRRPDGEPGFSLLFRGPLEPKLPQMIRSLGHSQLGNLDIFLVPVREDEQGRYYEAIFN